MHPDDFVAFGVKPVKCRHSIHTQSRDDDSGADWTWRGVASTAARGAGYGLLAVAIQVVAIVAVVLAAHATGAVIDAMPEVTINEHTFAGIGATFGVASFGMFLIWLMFLGKPGDFPQVRPNNDALGHRIAYRVGQVTTLVLAATGGLSLVVAGVWASLFQGTG